MSATPQNIVQMSRATYDALQAENARLREALEWIMFNTRGPKAGGYWVQVSSMREEAMSADDQAREFNGRRIHEKAKAALRGEKVE